MSASYLQLLSARAIRILSLPVDPYWSLRETNEPVIIAVDSTGIRSRRTVAGSSASTGRSDT